MRILFHALMVTSLAAAAGTPALASPEASTLAVIEERVYVETTVDSDNNGRPDRVAIDIARTSGATNLPVVFEHSPYRDGLNNYPNHNVNVDRLPQEDIFGASSSGFGTSAKKAVPDLPGWYDDYFLPRGYAVVLGHSIGTGSSDGCPTSGDMQETLGTTAVIDWLNGRARGYNSSGQEVQATWANGNVGMIGISYNGTLPNMAAATGVEGLKAIVPIAAISSWYDYYRANGLVVAPGGYQGEDADVLAHAVVKRSGCTDEIQRITDQQDRVTGDYTQFWRDRDYVDNAADVTAATFVIHGQADWNVKGMHYAQWYQALRDLGKPRKIWLHRGGHGTASRSDYQSTVGRWFDRYVKGIDNGIDREPKADVQYGDGTWRTYADWPDPTIGNAVFHLGATSPTAPGTLSLSPTSGNVDQSFVDQGRTTSAGTLVSNPDSANANRLVYRSAPLTSQTRLSGVPVVKLRAAVDNRNDANLTALLVEYSGSSPTIVTRGWMDPQNRNGHTGEPLVRGQEYDMTFRMQPRDYFFEEGNRIGLVVISTDYDYTLRPLGGSQLHIDPALSSLTLPMVGLPSGDDFSVSVSPGSGSADPGGTVTATVSTATTSGSPQTVNLAASGLPSGATATFDPPSVTSGGSSTVTIGTTASTPPGTYPITITGTGTSGARTATYSLTVNGTSPGGCRGYESTFTGTLSSGGSVYQPDGRWFYTGYSGLHEACLDGPDGTDFDLYLQKWSGYSWSTVDRSTSSGPDESLSYNGSAGYYRYRVHAYSGSGSYTLGYNSP